MSSPVLTPQPTGERSLLHRALRLFRVFLALLSLGGALNAAHAGGAYELQGLNQGDPNTWVAGNLQGWIELDYIPCRLWMTNGPIASQTFTITFPHILSGSGPTGFTPGFENLYDFVGSSNLVFLSPPVLSSPVNGDWSYTFTVQVTNTDNAAVYFSARMAAGAHLNTGSSLQIGGVPQSMGQLQIHKPNPVSGSPDLAIRKTGPTQVPQGGYFTYTLAYTNKAVGAVNGGVGVQISDIFPPEISVVTNSLGPNAHFAGNTNSTLFWDLTNLPPLTAGQITFQARVNPSVPVGRSFVNFSQILSAQDDANYADNVSTWTTTVTGSCTGSPITCAGNKTVQCGTAWTFDTPAPGNNTDSNAIVVLSTVTNAACGNTFSATRTWQGTNACGTTNVCSQTVTVVDTTAPIITCSTNRTVLTGVAWTFDDPSATDNCGSATIAVVNTVTNILNGCTETFAATRTWRATDDCGNWRECSQTVTVVDRTPPVVTCPPNISVRAAPGLCYSNVTFVIGATDNCGVTNLVSSPTSGSAFAVGVTTVTVTARDSSGNTSTCLFAVTVSDDQKPVVNCPSDLVLNTDPGRCSRSNVTFTVSATDNCSVTNLVSNPPSGSTFPLGATIVTSTATDSSGNKSSCSFTVTVTDSQNATINCPSNLVVAADPGQCSRSNVTFSVSASDNCSVTNLVSSVSSGSTFPLGTTTVTNTVTDSSGNTSSCVFTVTVTDPQSPVITCPSNLVLTTDPGQCSRSNVTYAVAATDNCSIKTLVTTPPSGSTFPLGTTVVTSTATDASGNKSSCSFTVTIRDTQNSVITCPSNMVLAADPGRCSRSNVTYVVTAADNCSVTNVVSNPTSGSVFPVGVTTVTNTAVDASGNVTTCTFTVTVTDDQSPVIACPANLVLTADPGRCSRSNVTFTVTATDNCGVTSLVSSPPSGSTFALGTTTVTNTAMDASGNRSICTFTVTVTDAQNPTIVCPNNLVVAADPGQCSRSSVSFYVSASDNCRVTNLVSVPPSDSPFPVGVTTVTNTATDASGNRSSCTFTVTVTDNQNPVITCPSDLVLPADPGKCSRSNVTFSVSATDNCGVVSLVSVPPSGSTFPLGLTTVTTTARDASGNESTCTFNVRVTDTQNVTVICPTNQVLEAEPGQCGRHNVTFVVIATDNCTVTNVVSNPSSGGLFPIGVTTVTNTATDASGNTASCTFTVTVLDTQSPTIVCPGNLVLTADPGRCSRSNVVFSVTAADNCRVASLVSVPPSGSTFPLGITTVTSTATDGAGNQSSCTFTVTVRDTQNAVITCSSNLVLAADPGRCSRSNVTFFVSATDNCSVTNLVSSTVSGSTFPVGTTTVTNTATDASGNQSSCIFTVTITDPQSPTIACQSNLVLSADPGRCSRSNVTFFVSANDNCSVTNLVSSSVSGGTFPVGTTIVTNTATDASGNQAGCTFTVTVTDNERPGITCPADLVLPADPGRCSRSNVTYTVSATDNCSVASVVTVPPSGSTFPVGVTTVTSTATDASGNQSTCSFTVTIADSQNAAITCSSNLLFAADPGQCSRSNVTFALSASDNCGVTNLVSSIVSGSTFPVGTTTVTNTATDASGNTSSCIFTVTVTEAETPHINCPSSLLLPADPGQCSRSNVLFNVTATDNCRVTNLTSSIASGSTFPVGTTIVTNTATDASGNQTSCTFTVTVTDGQNPVVSCPANLVLPTDPGRCSRSNVLFNVAATDNCTVTNVTSSIASGSTFPLGVTTVTNFVTDASGNVSSCTFTVTITDGQGPVINCPNDLVRAADPGECSRGNVNFNVSATDNCNLANLVSIPPSGSTFPVGVTTVTNIATDDTGNQTVCTFHVTVLDTQNPVITCPANLVLPADPGRCSRSNVTFLVSATDNCAVTNVVSVPPSGSTFPLGVTIVTNTATDSSGRSSACTFTVTVIDTQSATLTCSSNLVFTADPGQCSRSNVTFFVGATDNCSVTNVSSSSVSGGSFPVGTTTVTNTATDASGNVSTCTFTVTVLDTQNPAITCSSNLVLAADPGRCSRSNVTFFISATDNCSVTNFASSIASGGTFPVGTTTVTNTVTDASGNQASCTFTVTVTDNQNPVIACPANLVLPADPGRCNRSNVTYAASATDNCAIASVVLNPPSGSTFPVGVTTVTATATDLSGNQSSCTFTVTVTDTQNATLTCSSNLVLTADPGRCSRSNVTFFVGATDNCSVTNVSSSIVSGSTFPVGTTTVTNTATDASGNTSSCTFTVTVLDPQYPVIICPPSLVLSADAGRCSRSNVTFVASAQDNCTVTNVVSSIASGSTFPVGTTIVTNTATDASGNQATCTFTVTITDNQNPVITCPPNLLRAADAGSCSRSNVIFSVSAADNCSVTNLVSSPPSGSTFPLGVTIVTNTATDASGNRSTCTFTVTVTDTQGPLITCPGNLVLPTDPGRCNRSNVTFAVNATDNCSLTNLAVSPPSGSAFPLGVTQVTGVATDASGNQSSCTFTVTIQDQEPPSINCPPDITTNTAPGAHSVTNIALGTPATADNCGVAAFGNNAPTVFPEGTNFVTWVVTDYSGNNGSCVQRVVVVPTCSGVLNATGVVSQATCAHRPVVFEVTASSPEPITYRWLFKGQPMLNQTNRTLVLPDPDESQAGNYTLEARTECAFASLTAQLTVLPTSTNNPTALTNSTGIIIAEIGEAVPYGSAISPQCVPGVVSGVTVTLYGFSHRFPDDVHVVLVGPDGGQIKLMGRAGGDQSVLGGVNLTFSDAAPNPLPRNDQIVSGNYLPTDYQPDFLLSPPANGPYFTNLASFNGINPNGPWRLFAYDAVAYDGGQIDSWTLNLEWRPKTLVLRNPTRLANGAFQVEVWGLPGIPTIIQRSTNFSAWTSIATNVFATEKGIFTDPSPPSPRSVYRALQP